LLNALDLRMRAAEIVVIGPNPEPLAAAARALPYVNRIVLRARTAADLPANHPARAAFTSLTGTAALVCVGEKCSRPVTEPAQLVEAVRTVSETASA